MFKAISTKAVVACACILIGIMALRNHSNKVHYTPTNSTYDCYKGKGPVVIDDVSDDIVKELRKKVAHCDHDMDFVSFVWFSTPGSPKLMVQTCFKCGVYSMSRLMENDIKEYAQQKGHTVHWQPALDCRYVWYIEDGTMHLTQIEDCL